MCEKRNTVEAKYNDHGAVSEPLLSVMMVGRSDFACCCDCHVVVNVLLFAVVGRVVERVVERVMGRVF